MYPKYKREVKEQLPHYLDQSAFEPLEVKVTGSFEEAFRRFKTQVQNEGVVATYKARQSYEKPSERKRRKRREAEERRLLQASREAQMISGEWDKRQKRKEQKRQARVERRKQEVDLL